MSRPVLAPAPRLTAAPAGIGIVAPHDLALDRELWAWTPEPVSLYVTRTSPPELTSRSVEGARQLANVDAVAEACRRLAVPQPGVIAYLCTSCSFVSGVAGERALRDAMVSAGAPEALTTSGALLEALEALGARRVAIATPYDAAVTGRLEAFLSQAGIETSSSAYLGMDADVWRVAADSVRSLVAAVPLEGADAVFLSCTNLPTRDVVADLEREFDLPVISANLVTIWAALRRLRVETPGRPERLFSA